MNKILPDKITNDFKANKILIYVFCLITLITIARSLIHIFAIDGGAQSIAGFPLETYSPEASKAVVLIFSVWGLSQLIMGIFYLIVLLKYKSLIPLMYLFLFLEYTGRLLLGIYKSAESTHVVPGSIANYLMIPLSLVLFILCLRHKS